MLPHAAAFQNRDIESAECPIKAHPDTALDTRITAPKKRRAFKPCLFEENSATNSKAKPPEKKVFTDARIILNVPTP